MKNNSPFLPATVPVPGANLPAEILKPKNMKPNRVFRTKELVSFFVILICLLSASFANAQTYGAPLFTENFGVVPLGTATPLNYRVAITGRGTIGSAYTFNPTGQTDDGKYALTPDPTKIHSTAWIDMADHTANDVNGLMLVVNAALTKGLFYKRAVTGLCYNSQFEFKAYYANVLHKLLGCQDQIPINIRFEIWSVDPGDLETNSTIVVGNLAPNGAKLLAAMNTGDVAATNQTKSGTTYSQNVDWRSTSLIFNVPQSTDGAFLVLRNNGNGGCGNDLAIDDITFSPYIPFTVGYNAITTNYCSSKTIRLQGTIASGSIPSTIPYVFQWQVADKGTTNWSGIGGTITSFANAYIDLNVGDIGNKIYRIISAADVQNFNNTNCFVASTSFDGNSVVLPTGSITTTNSDVCGTAGNTPAEATFTVNYQGNIFPWTYFYKINGGTEQSQTVNGPNVFSDTKTISITDNSIVNLVKISTSGQFGCDVDINSNLSLTYSVGAPPAPVQIIGPNPACIGSTADFSVFAVPGAISYNWIVSGGGWQIISGQGTNSVQLFIGTTPITVSITTINACGTNSLNSIPFQTTNSAPAATSDITTPNGLCFPSSNTSGSTDILFEASEVPGSQNYNWEWDSPVILSSSQIVGTTGQYLRKIILSVPNSVNSFNIRVRTQNGCGYSTKKEVTFTPNRPPAVDAGADFTKTCTENPTGKQIGIAPVDGVTYLWSPATDLTDATIANPTANPSATTIYTLTATNTASGCTNTDAVTVTVDKSVPVADAGADFTKTCTVNLTGKQIGVAPVDGVTYSWSPATDLTDATIANPTANPSATTIYTLTATKTASGCTNTDAVTVTVDKSVPVADAGADFTKTCTVNPTGKQIGVAPVDGVTYLWSPATDLTDATVSNPTANPCGTTTYTLTATNTVSGCTAADEVTVTIEYQPFASIAATSETSECFHYPTLQEVKDNCGNILTPSEPVLTPLQDCEGCMTFTYTYTDCAGNQQDYVHTLCIRRTTLPVEVGTPVSISSTVELIAGVIPPVPPVLPVVMDVCGKTLTHGEPVIGGTYDGTEGSYSFTYTYTDCPGLKFIWTYTYTVVPAVVIPSGETQLSYRFANPRITNISSVDYFKFDVQVKANVGGTAFLKGNVNLDFNTTTLCSNETDWRATPISGYSADLTILGTNLNVALETLSSGTVITSAYQTLVTLTGKIMDNTGVAGIDFNEGNMNGQQSYKLSADPLFAAYYNPNGYDKADFIDTYVGRVFASIPGWTQIGGSVHWADNLNTSVWEGNATMPGGSDVSNAANLRVHSPAILTIPANGKMTANGNTEIKSPVGLRIESDGSGTGSLITGTASGAGATVAHRYMTTGAWHFVTSPVTGQSISNFITSNLNIATDVDADIYAADAMRGMMDYNPDLKGWNDYFNNSTAGNLETGKGFSIRTNAASAVNFRGNLQAGSLYASGLVAEKWNCIGNPYTSAIGINESSSSGLNNFLAANSGNLDPSFGAVYVWDNLDANNGLDEMYTVITNATPGFDVQQGQAFMVKMNSSTAIGFNSSMQIHIPSLGLKSTKGVWPTIKLEASVNNRKSSTIIAFDNGMTRGLDFTYDAGFLSSSSDLIVYTKLVEDNGIPFAIQALPADFSNLIIPVGIESKTGGEVVFSSKMMNLPSACQVILEDKMSKTFTDLSQNVYRTAIEANSSSSDRFRLHTSSQTTGIDKGALTGSLSAYAFRNIEIRINGQVSNQAVATLYDVQGRVILVKTLEEGSLNVVRTPNIKTAIYMLSVNDKGKIQRFKIPVNE